MNRVSTTGAKIEDADEYAEGDYVVREYTDAGYAKLVRPGLTWRLDFSQGTHHLARGCAPYVDAMLA